ncbi:hypothetical protein PQ469_04235 [Mucilaginibacter sp. KACC 22773]|jgi:hypothetical protein|uniref:hypothetical protein n=1 Tax=Mucilaginibacter sp. KACC 22773 TaxID=3025671 RepID=UPI002367078E|nr:hypothetical protein [Mucilaginibacter sp. KACC 22773]WDF79209.1 hypothetical protein PQ469_04235 [Mucilaginibacter sp. KACC 22773]
MKTQKIVVITALCLIGGLLIFSGVSKYIEFSCANSFGPEFNKKRKELHIPIIPPAWEVYFKDKYATAWQARRVSRGHSLKVVVYNGCDLDAEEDHYYFSSKKMQDTVLTAYYKYVNRNRGKDSTVFIFQIGDHTDTISSKKADSIFVANRISKDL